MGFFSTLNKEQKEALGLLQMGTFLEYFDLMLYIHMAVLLNDLFFPKTDPQTAALLAAFAFCSTYVMRPIGALLFGWLGDNIGRKSTIIITTIMMSVSCLLMANLPTYSQIGISAAWIVTLCRIFQGMSSMGEIVGAEIYVAEFISRPASYPAVAFVTASANMGATAALTLAMLISVFGFSWRIAFWVGACVALIGAVARTRLRETPDFLELKRQKMKQAIAQLSHGEKRTNSKKPIAESFTWKEPIKTKTLVSYFLIYCGWPLTFYLAYMYFNPVLKAQFNYTSEQIIKHNFFLSCIQITSGISWAYLSYYYHPLRLLKFRWVFTCCLMITMPFLIMFSSTFWHIFMIQASILLFSLASFPAEAIFYYHLPIYRRFTFASFLYALSRALMYIITSLGLVYLGNYFGNYGLWFITMPITLSYIFGVYHFQYLETKLGIYPNLIAQKNVNNQEILPVNISNKNLRKTLNH